MTENNTESTGGGGLGRLVRKIILAGFMWRERGSGHFGRPKDIAWTLRDLLCLRVTTWLRGWDR